MWFAQLWKRLWHLRSKAFLWAWSDLSLKHLLSFYSPFCSPHSHCDFSVNTNGEINAQQISRTIVSAVFFVLFCLDMVYVYTQIILQIVNYTYQSNKTLPFWLYKSLNRSKRLIISFTDILTLLLFVSFLFLFYFSLYTVFDTQCYVTVVWKSRFSRKVLYWNWIVEYVERKQKHERPSPRQPSFSIPPNDPPSISLRTSDRINEWTEINFQNPCVWESTDLRSQQSAM